jgi:hypothetical protein
VNESMAGTMRIDIFPSAAAVAGPVAAADAGAVVVAGMEDVEGGAGDDSARRRVPFWDARTWTSRFMGVCPCRSRNVGVVGESRPVSFVLAAAVLLPPPPPPPPPPPIPVRAPPPTFPPELLLLSVVNRGLLMLLVAGMAESSSNSVYLKIG